MTTEPTKDSLDLVRRAHTASGNYDLDNDAVIGRLTAWQSLCDFTVTQAGGDRLELAFDSLPQDMDAFVQDVAQFCPDLISQGTGTVRDLVEMQDMMPLPPNLVELIEGIDFDDENHPYEILKRQVVRDKKLRLWWD